jgi:hypothetical protein
LFIASSRTQDTFSLIVCNLPVVVTAVLRQIGKDEEETDHTNQSTFGWKAATRKSAMTSTMNSDTARDVTTVNLRDFTTNTVITNPTLSQINHETRTVQYDAAGDLEAALPALGMKDETQPTQVKQQRSIVWITSEKLQRSESHEDKEDEEK